MSFRTRIALTVIAIVVATNVLSMVLLIRLSQQHLRRELGNKLRSVAVAAALAIDAASLEGIRTAADTGSPAFERTRAYLRGVMKRNQTEGISDIYIMRRTEDPGRLAFVVDADESAQAQAPGASYDLSRAPLMASGFDGPVAEPGFTRDEFGVTLSAYAPIHDGSGRPVAMLGIDARTGSLDQLRRGFCFSVGAALALGALLAVLAALWASASIAGPIQCLIAGTGEVARGNFGVRFEIYSPEEFVRIASACNDMVAGLRERDAIRQTFSRYVSPQVAAKILEDPSRSQVAAELKNLSVLFSDVRGFTTLSETMPPEDVLRLLNDYFSRMIEVLFEFEGTLDKFIGDGLMAVFGAPFSRDDDPERAVRCAVKMQQQAAVLRATVLAAGGPELRVGIGINTGAAVVGNVGSSQRQEYTSIGDSVNLASRIQSRASGGQVLISESTHYFVRDLIEAVAWEPIQVKGRAEPVRLFQVLGIRRRAPAGGLERRRHLRASTLLQAVRSGKTGTALAELADLSAGGAALLSSQPLEPGARFDLTVTLPDGSVHLRALLVDSSELDPVEERYRHLHHVAFEALAAVDRDRITRFVYEHAPAEAAGFERAG